MDKNIAATVPENLPKLITNSAAIHRDIRAAQAHGKKVGLVPTMGALHKGHLSLVRASRNACDVTVVTIFVNPTQFGPSEDFQSYPRRLETDMKLLSDEGVDIVFAPQREAIYRPGHSTYVAPPLVAQPLEGKCRPSHFRGVTTIVLKLFNLIPADAAFFGRKDFQQSLVIRRMAEDLDVPIDIRVCPTVREEDGLAISSRNAFLSDSERNQAMAISQALQKADELHAAGQREASPVLAQMRTILTEAGISNIDYIALADPETLDDCQQLNQPCVALIAAHVGKTRLIDNWPIG